MIRILLLAAMLAAPAVASVPGSYAQVDAKSAAACLKAANLRNAKVGLPVRFSDTLLIDARTITGAWPQPHMKGAKATMLCLYNRRTGTVEVQEAR